jgi:hypothetical protein
MNLKYNYSNKLIKFDSFSKKNARFKNINSFLANKNFPKNPISPQIYSLHYTGIYGKNFRKNS